MSSVQAAKLQQVTSLLAQLQKDWTDKSLTTKQRDDVLTQLKVHGRVVSGAEPVFTEQGIHTLASYGFDQDVQSTSQEALRCLANSLLLQPQTRQTLVDAGYTEKAIKRLKTDSIDEEFLISRIIFLLTYDTRVDFNTLLTEGPLAEGINYNISRHSKRFTADKPSPVLAGMDEMALTDSLKLLFNLTSFYKGHVDRFSDSIPAIFDILNHIDPPRPPSMGVVQYLINPLLNLDLTNSSSHFSVNPMFPESDLNQNVKCLIRIFERLLSDFPETELDSLATPILTLLRRVFEIAPESTQKYMQTQLLPSDDERNQPLGHSNSLSSRLLQQSTSALTPSIRTSIQAMLFELSGKDAAQFIHNVGYGYASGFLLNNNIPTPDNMGMDANESDPRAFPVNPITGQRLDAEPSVPEEPMTEEEQEREAERLFVLFERLRQTGVVNVQNPVTQAYQEGRFEELDD